MAELQPPVIVVPGITATSLEDTYPLSPDEIWSPILSKNYERISMHPDDPRYEALEPARVLPRTMFGIVYNDLVEALRHDLTPSADKPTPVYAFPYDWRQDCRRSVERLSEFVVEVLNRTRLLPHYADNPPKRVDLVGHSMGGLLISGYLTLAGSRNRVRRVVTIGTPFRGAVDAVSKLTTGMGTLTGDAPRDRERESARTIPAIYQLLPSFAGLPNLFSKSEWQPSVLETLKEYCKQHQAKISGEALFGKLLKMASDFRKMTDGLDPDKALPEGRDGWMPIVGLDAPTQVRFDNTGTWFDFPEPENGGPESESTGDGTVPFLGACPVFLERARLACVTPDEFSFWELKDRAMAKLAGFHGALPTVNLVQRIAIRFLDPSFSGDVQARPAPGVQTTQWPSWLPRV
jgi:pimeloyl-ACP methyl ester carboxylesterase